MIQTISISLIPILLAVLAYLLKMIIDGQKKFNEAVTAHMNDTNIHKAVISPKVDELSEDLKEVRTVQNDHGKRITILEAR